MSTRVIYCVLYIDISNNILGNTNGFNGKIYVKSQMFTILNNIFHVQCSLIWIANTLIFFALYLTSWYWLLKLNQYSHWKLRIYWGKMQPYLIKYKSMNSFTNPSSNIFLFFLSNILLVNILGTMHLWRSGGKGLGRGLEICHAFVDSIVLKQ